MLLDRPQRGGHPSGHARSQEKSKLLEARKRRVVSEPGIDVAFPLAVQAASGPAGRVEPTCDFRYPQAKPLCSRNCGPSAVKCMEVSVPQLPDRPNLEHLKKQAKDLLREFQSGNPQAVERFRTSLPAVKTKADAALTASTIRLHDAQSCVAREYGFASWDELRTYVGGGQTHLIHEWLALVYGHGYERPRASVAARMLEAKPDLVVANLLIGCAVG
jgi:hypothetical protein